MRYIAAREYADRKGLSVGHVYQFMKDGKVPFVPQTKVVKRIPWDDTIQEACQSELVAHVRLVRAIVDSPDRQSRTDQGRLSRRTGQNCVLLR